MTDFSKHNSFAPPSPLAGLKPTRLHGEVSATEVPAVTPRDMNRFARSMLNTVPMVLVGSMAVAGLNLTGAIDEAVAEPSHKPKSETAELSGLIRASEASRQSEVRDALASANSSVVSAAQRTAVDEQGTLSVASTAPSTYKVEGGDTVSSIAGRFGLSTASVLALNGLGWKSVIYPGQTLKLTSATAAAPVAAAPTVVAPASTSSSSSSYTIATGDTVSSIATRFGVSIEDILSANGLSWSSVIYAGRTLTIPGGSASTIQPVSVVTPVAAAPVAATPAASGGQTYTIVAGDTISGIAAKFGVSVQSVLDANGLNQSSIIFSGRTLQVGGAAPTITPAAAAAPVAVVEPASTGSSVTPLSDEMAVNAATIVSVGRSLGVSDYGLVIALAAAMQESSLRNIDYGDRDSVGLFQQRPSTGWGSAEQLTTPSYAARLFFGGPSNPNTGVTRGLLDIRDWESMSVTDAAQAVQISAYPDAYAKWEPSARAWLAAIK
jgi:LysM repeat protein